MQDRYAGDIGDFVKLGLLRAISPGYQLGLAWYRYPDELHNGDGRHILYLEQPDKYRPYDPQLFDHLKNAVVVERSINSLLPTLAGAESSDETLGMREVPFSRRRDWRSAWFRRTLDGLSGCNLVFADPDNGIVDNNDKRRGKATFGKQIPLDEVWALAKGRCAIVYHHNTRRTGGHDLEVDYLLQEIGMGSIAVRATAYSPRTFFVINPDSEIENRVSKFCKKWTEMRVSLHGSKQ